MMLEAKIVLEYPKEKTAEAVVKAVSPDNICVPKELKIQTWKEGKTVLTEIKLSNDKLSTFIATIEDLLRSISVAEKTVSALEKVSKH